MWGAPRFPLMSASASPNTRILVVDDEPDIAESFVDLLRSFMPGVKVDSALTGEDALRSLREHSVDLILTDFMMPGMNGVQFLREAERLVPGTPNILVTAYEPEAVRAAGPPLPNRILHKPFEIDEFQGAVMDALAEA
jgi:CheY-like chemotaxis protein